DGTATSQKALGPLAGVVAYDGTATSQKALGPLVRSEGDILTRYARSDSGPLRDTRAGLALSFRQEAGFRVSGISPATCKFTFLAD
ncbi:MAG: hypothetical protein V5A43_07760, partial [Haloarculaceae archaeon]